METVEYIWLNIWCMLDAVVPGRDELRECNAEHLMAQHGETRIYVLEVELKMDARQTVKE